MPTNQETLHTALRAATSNTGTINEDWHALFDQDTIATGFFNERLLLWLNAYLGTTYTNLPEAKQAYAESLGFFNWDSINSWDLSLVDYVVNGFDPDTVADFAGVLNNGTEYYRVGGVDSTFNNMFTYTGASNKVMTDSDGNLKWAPHNILNDSSDLSTANWTAEQVTVSSDSITGPFDGTNADLVAETTANNFHRVLHDAVSNTDDDYTIKFWIKPYGTRRYFGIRSRLRNANDTVSFDTTDVAIDYTASGYSNASITAVNDGWFLFSVDVAGVTGGTNTIGVFSSDAAVTTNSLPTFVGSTSEGFYLWGVHIYRSSLGGMVDNPDRSDSYVPTTSSAVYLPRRNSYRYNGSSYVKKGITLEPAAATNLMPYSVIDDGTQWTETFVTNTVNSTASPTGQTDASLITASSGNNVHRCGDQLTVAASADPYSFSMYIKDGTAGYGYLFISGGAPGLDAEYVFNLTTGGVAQTLTAGDKVPTVEDVGNSWWRITIYDTTNGTGGSPTFFVGPHDGSASNIWNAAGTETIYAWGSQAEQSSTISSHIPTSGATATRAAETLSIDGGNWATNQTGMSWHIQGELNIDDDNDGFADVIMESYLNAGAFLQFRADTDTNDWFARHITSVGTGDDAAVNFGSTSYGINQPINIAFRLENAGELNGADAGTSGTADTHTGTIAPGYSSAALSIYGGTATDAERVAQGTVALIRQWDEDIGDTGIEEATS